MIFKNTIMKTKYLLIFLFLNLTGNYLIAQDKTIDTRFNGKEIRLREFLGSNIVYSAEAIENKSIGYSITSVTITPEGDIFDISTVNPICKSIDENIIKVLRSTKNKWLECDSISINQTFYIPVVYVLAPSGESFDIENPVNEKYNFVDPIVITAMPLLQKFIPEDDASVAAKLSESLSGNDYQKALDCVDELIRRNPFNRELYQLRLSINRKLNKNDLVLKDAQKMQNFIPGVSLDELLNKN